MTFKDPTGCDIVPSSKMQSLVLCGSGAVKMEDVYKDECERLRKEIRDKEALIVELSKKKDITSKALRYCMNKLCSVLTAGQWDYLGRLTKGI